MKKDETSPHCIHRISALARRAPYLSEDPGVRGREARWEGTKPGPPVKVAPNVVLIGGPGAIRTPDPQIRRLTRLHFDCKKALIMLDKYRARKCKFAQIATI